MTWFMSFAKPCHVWSFVLHGGHIQALLFSLLNFLHPASSCLKTFRLVYTSLGDSRGTSLEWLTFIVLECLLGPANALDWIMLHVKAMFYALQCSAATMALAAPVRNVLDITDYNGKGVTPFSGVTESVRLLLHDVHYIAVLTLCTVPMNICGYSVCIFNLPIDSFTLSRRDTPDAES